MVLVGEWVGVMLCTVLLFKYASSAPYTIKWIIFSFGSGFIVLVSVPFMILRPKDYRNALYPAWACRQLCRALGVTMEIRGLENIQTDRGGVVIMNHQSAFDLCVLSYLWPVIGRATVVAKQEILYYPVFGIGAWLWGTLFINRKDKNTIQKLYQESEAINEKQCKLLIFPEGTRNTSQTLLPFRKGAFHIAVESGCPIQPVVISKYWFLNTQTKCFNPGHAIIHILPEISPESYTKDTVEEFAQHCRAIMQDEFSRLSQESKYANDSLLHQISS